MRIAVYTLTRDRLEYTKDCFDSLWNNAGREYDHFVIDNGSVDGTVEWLKENEQRFKKVIYNPENVGISRASNQALEEIEKGTYDIIIKMDNDCLVKTPGILSKIEKLYELLVKRIFDRKYILSPRVTGIMNQPTRSGGMWIDEFQLGYTGIVGGLFHIVPSEVYRKFRYDNSLPKAWGQDDAFCKWVKTNGGEVGYIENIEVEHYEGTENQAKKFPEYFGRKWAEEKI